MRLGHDLLARPDALPEPHPDPKERWKKPPRCPPRGIEDPADRRKPKAKRRRIPDCARCPVSTWLDGEARWLLSLHQATATELARDFPALGMVAAEFGVLPLQQAFRVLGQTQRRWAWRGMVEIHRLGIELAEKEREQKDAAARDKADRARNRSARRART